MVGGDERRVRFLITSCVDKPSMKKVGLPVDKDDLINYQILIIYQLLMRTSTNQPTVHKVWKLTNTTRVGLDVRSSHVQRLLGTLET